MDQKVEDRKPVGRPPTRKKLLTLRLEPEIVEHFRGYGKGWLQNVNDVLKRSMLAQTSKKQWRGWDR